MNRSSQVAQNALEQTKITLQPFHMHENKWVARK